MTGRRADPRRRANTSDYDAQYSQEAMVLGAKCLKGFLGRNGFGAVPVRTGSIMAKTIVPHNIHFDDAELDFYGDATNSAIRLDGSLDDAIASLRGQKDLKVVVGGPFTDAAHVLKALPGQISLATAQAGLFGFGTAKAMHGVSFNVGSDPKAFGDWQRLYRGKFVVVSSDVTKSHGFGTPRDFATVVRNSEVIQRVTRFWELALRDRKNPQDRQIYMHDAYPIMLLGQELGDRDCQEIFEYEPVRFTPVDEKGDFGIGARGAAAPGDTSHFVVMRANYAKFYQSVGRLLK